MTIARKEIVKPNKEAFYHCIARCVRRAFLCGYDRFTGNNYDHRKMWIKKRIKLLSEIFLIDVCGYAVMSNHLHIILRTRPDLIKKLEDEDVVKRWLRLFPKGRDGKGKPVEPTNLEIMAILNDEEKLLKLKDRLGSISWFMRCVNEYIARLSNKEDKCKGRFWEGRFSCQRVLDEAGLLTCMTYVDLNPVRAKIEVSPEDSTYTSGYDRIRARRAKEKLEILKSENILSENYKNEKNKNKLINNEITKSKTADWLSPISMTESKEKKGLLSISLEEYLEVLDYTGREISEGNRGKIPLNLKPILKRLEINEKKWLKAVKSYGSLFYRVSGKVESITNAAKEAKRNWLKGMKVSREIFQSAS